MEWIEVILLLKSSQLKVKIPCACGPSDDLAVVQFPRICSPPYPLQHKYYRAIRAQAIHTDLGQIRLEPVPASPR